MTQMLTPGQETYMNIRRAPQDGQPGALLFVVLVQLFHDGVSLTFNSHPILNRALPVAEGRAYLRFLQQEAVAGTPVWLIIERAGAWTTAAAVASEAALIADINARMDEVAARRDTTDLTTDCQAIAADAPNWNAFRQGLTRTAKPTSDPMDRILDNAVNGYIRRSKQATSTQLIALKRRGLVELHWGWQGKTRVLNGAWLAGAKRVAA